MSAGEMVIGAREYTYEVTREYFTLICDKDNEVETYEETLVAQLSKLTRDVDYNGHFGEYIFFTIDDVDDCEELREQIRTMIHTYAESVA